MKRINNLLEGHSLYADCRMLNNFGTLLKGPKEESPSNPSLANPKWVNQVTNRVMSPGTIMIRTSPRIDLFLAGGPRIRFIHHILKRDLSS